jgi:uncharacterized protein involved in type VI secretion and phage assembly
MPEAVQKFYGKYRGTVINNIDPMQIGRLLVSVTDVSGIAPTSWALPCLPLAGMQNGLFTVPMIGSKVWIEFEQGNPDQPIWVGGFWGTAAEVPMLAKTAPPPINSLSIQTPLQNGLIVTDLPGPSGGIMLKSATNAMIIVNDTGIYIQNGKGASIIMTGPTVTINNGALVIT